MSEEKKRYQIKETSGEWVDTHELMYSRFPEDRRRIIDPGRDAIQMSNSAHGFTEGSEQKDSVTQEIPTSDAAKAWERENKHHPSGINPHAFILGYDAAKSDLWSSHVEPLQKENERLKEEKEIGYKQYLRSRKDFQAENESLQSEIARLKEAHKNLLAMYETVRKERDNLKEENSYLKHGSHFIP